MKILIVDDSNIVRKTIQRTLDNAMKAEIFTAGNGLEALEIYRSARPDVVTLDITMPHMDGLTCLEELLKIDSRAKVLVISALSDRATAIAALKRGAEAFLCKPFTSAELIEAFQELYE